MVAMSRLPRTSPDFCYPPGLVSVEVAREFILSRARPLEESEAVAVEAALGRVVARDERSPIDVPGHDNSAMDGYAVRSGDLRAGENRLPVSQRVAAGRIPEALGVGEAARIFTGAALPPGADAVVMQEQCRREGDTVVIPGPVPAGENLRPRGNDIRAGAEVLARGQRIRPQEMGLAASLGLAQVEAYRRLRVAILSSGDELVVPGEPLFPGAVYNSNRYTMTGLVQGLGMDLVDLGRVADDLEATCAALGRAAKMADVIVTSGGMSVGEEDHLKAAVERIGRLEMWKVAVRPGKPLAYGRIDGADFLGLPGNPVSTLVTFCLFVRPFLLARQGASEVLPRAWPVDAGFRWDRPAARREFARGGLEAGSDGGVRAILFPRQGSDVLTSTVWAQGLVEIPEGCTVAPGDRVLWYDFRELLG
jgi:molybdopterin molybdotransferase